MKKLFEFIEHIGRYRVLVGTKDISDGAITSEKLAPKSVKAKNIREHEVGWNKLDDELQNIIASSGEGGVALSKDFGNSELLGITQKKLTEEHNERLECEGHLQDQINAIINDKAEVSLSVSPNPVFVGAESNISLVAVTNTEATNIKIKKGSMEIASGDGMSLDGTDTISPSEAGNTTYTAEFTIAGLQKTATKNVIAVYPIKYGAGQAYTDAAVQASVRATPIGTYDVQVANNDDYVFFVVPRTMNINSAKMSGFDFPLQAPQNVEIDGVAYKYYQSINAYDAGTLTIVIS